MSQLYQLFCQGLQDRSGEDVLSSTFIVTSTPLDLEPPQAGPGIGAASPNETPCSSQSPGPRSPLPPPVSRDEASPAHDGPAHEPGDVEGNGKAMQHDSVQAQVGSATESPPVDEEKVDGVPSPAAATVPQDIQAAAQCLTTETQPVYSKDKPLSSQSNNTPNRPPAASQQSKEHAGNVSPVDFVDRIIALKRLDEAFANKPKPKPKPELKRTSRPSTSTDESEPEHDEPVTKSRRGEEASDSSETDFEGATEYFKSRQTLNSTTEPDKSKTLPKKLSISSGKSTDESNMRLVMECITLDDSSPNGPVHQSQSVEVDNVLSPSAARCRVYLRKKDSMSKRVISQASQEDKGTPSTTSSTTGVLKEIQTSQQVSNMNTDTGCSKSSAIMNGVTAYVEVRSGHDNRSMVVRTQLRKLGARVLEKLTSEVTHVVFNEGAASTLRKAQKQGCHLVSVLWIEECKKLGRIASEANHPALNLHLYDNPQPYRKLKSFQPDFEEDKAEEKKKKQLKRLKARSQKAILSQQTRPSSPSDDSSLEEESSDEISKGKHHKQLIPDGVILKTVSIVLKKIDAIDPTGSQSVSSVKKNKRKLLPLTQRPPDSLSLEEFDLAERVRPAFPYSQPSNTQKKKNPTPRRIFKPSSSQSLRRRSSCFARSTQGLSASKPKNVKAPMRTMVCTFMHRREIDVVAAVLKQLGGWILEPTVSPRTTHVVCGESKRTINLLRGIAHGCWIVRQEWVLRSIEAGHWLDEEAFELTEFPAIQQSRVARETLGAPPNIFSSSGAIYVSKDTTPPHAEIADLLHLCGANLAKSARQARVIIGPFQRRSSHTDVVHVNEQWVLDSIQENMLQPVRNYRL